MFTFLWWYYMKQNKKHTKQTLESAQYRLEIILNIMVVYIEFSVRGTRWIVALAIQFGDWGVHLKGGLLTLCKFKAPDF